MERLLITGGRPLRGTVKVNGAKNSALKLMAAALLADGTSRFDNVPDILDCRTMSDVLRHLGAGVTWDGTTVAVDASTAGGFETPYELVSQMRASIVVLGPRAGMVHFTFRSWVGVNVLIS